MMRLQFLGLLVAVAAASGQVPSPCYGGERETVLRPLPEGELLYQPPPTLQGQDIPLAGLKARIRFAVIPGQDAAGRLWSSWGDALYASDGRFYVSLGDHGAPYGRSYVWAVNPDSGQLELAVDYNKVVGLSPPAYAPGKIHAPLVEGPDGGIYVVGYRGSVRQTGPETGFRGDWLVRFDPATGRCDVLGIPAPGYSTPVLAFCEGPRSLYALAVPGRELESAGPHSLFYRYDVARRMTAETFRVSSAGPRAMFVASDGRAWFNDEDGQLLRYQPVSAKEGTITRLNLRVPGDGHLRAASRPNRDGIAYGIARDGTLFTFDTRGERIETVGPVFPLEPRYTAVCKLDPTGRYLYYLPGAHGRTSVIGTPLVRMDTRTHAIQVVAYLHNYLRKYADYHAGGSYGFAIDRDGRSICVVLNGSSPPSSRQPDFGKVAVVLLDLGETGEP